MPGTLLKKIEIIRIPNPNDTNTTNKNIVNLTPLKASDSSSKNIRVVSVGSNNHGNRTATIPKDTIIVS